MGISPVAVYSEVDRSSLHVMMADEAYCVGPAPSARSYLNGERILEAAKKAGAQAIHPGYGFLAENAHFARACRDRGVEFIGPTPESIALMGDKIESRHAVMREGVPPVPGSEGSVKTEGELRDLIAATGFPVVLKASAGGGGKGMRVVRSTAELESALRSASGEAEAAFGNATLYMEKYIDRPRHIEVQVLADRHGNAIHLGERECSIQRRHQKVVEECPSPLVGQELRDSLGAAALAVVRAAGYVNAGTVEFLVDSGSDRPRFYFLEMNTRLQVEHPVTELVTGLDLVREQLLISAGEELSLDQSDVCFRGAALECRICAEDPDKNFFPSPGRIETLLEPSGPGVRNDSGVYQGYTVPLEYDSLISKLVTWGQDRFQAISRMKRALGEYKVGGVRTIIPFLDRLLSHAEFLSGNLHTHFIEEHGLAGRFGSEERDLSFEVAALALRHMLGRQSEGPREASARSAWKDYGRRDWH